MRHLSKFETWAKYNDIEKIKFFIESLDFKNVSDPSSNNQIFENKENIIIFKKNNCK